MSTNDKTGSVGGRNLRRLGPAISPERYQPIEDIPLLLSAELDRRTIVFREVLTLGIDSVVTLGRPSGENIDLYVGELFLGTGEILAVDGRLALRVADLRDKPTAVKRFDAKGAGQNS